MKAGVEVYKGIEFVRISSLTEEQAALIRSSSFAGKTIKILRDSELLSDCLLYSSYLEWYHQSSPANDESKQHHYSQQLTGLKFALK